MSFKDLTEMLNKYKTQRKVKKREFIYFYGFFTMIKLKYSR